MIPETVPIFLIKYIKGVRYQGCTERTVPYRVRKIAKKATVTFWMEPVWVVMTDT